MNIECNPQFTIYFGDKNKSFSLDQIRSGKIPLVLQDISQQVHAQQTAFLHQEHGAQGKMIDLHEDLNYFFQVTGDYLLTQKKHYGIGVVTADCLPIVMYDPVTHSAGIVHAGWKGLVAGVFQVAVQNMIDKMHVIPADLEIYIGPAARQCCYEVQQDFIDQFKLYESNTDIFIKKHGKIYFDSRSFITVIARNLGIKLEKLYTRYNVCTICDVSFCSYRREKDKAHRQITMICLH